MLLYGLGGDTVRTLVTGGSGFIGGHLISRLTEAGQQAFNFDIQDGDDIKCLERLMSVVSRVKPDVIFHLAGVLGTSELMEAAREAEEVNVIGTINVLETCRRHEIPMIFVGKVNPSGWLNPYTITKRACEEYCLMYTSEWRVKTCIVKPLNAYGPRQEYSPVQKFIPTFIHQALRGEPIPIWGSGEQKVDPVYVSDVVEALIRAWQRGLWGEVIEVGLGRPISVVEVAKKILELTASKAILEFKPMRPGEPKHSVTYARTRSMEELLGMRPAGMVQLEEGLSRTIEWWKDDRRLQCAPAHI